jgi:hypothetical protein
MRGISSDKMMTPKFFFVMDRLYETLDKRIAAWKNEKQAKKGQFFGLVASDKLGKLQLLKERLIVAYDLAAAFSYMHEHM